GLKRTQADGIAVTLRDVFGSVVAQGIVADPELLGGRLYASAGTHKKIKAAPLGMQADAALDLLVRSRPPASRHASQPAQACGNGPCSRNILRTHDIGTNPWQGNRIGPRICGQTIYLAKTAAPSTTSTSARNVARRSGKSVNGELHFDAR